MKDIKTLSYEDLMKLDIINYDDLNDAVSDILTDANKKVEDLVEKFNDTNEDGSEVDAVDLDSKFEPLHDYVGDYINE
jgi:hypothetical protein|tara:strand:- start:259 stop:492 length:234 start_codon:yes stop_codon:yes gene_type:complete